VAAQKSGRLPGWCQAGRDINRETARHPVDPRVVAITLTQNPRPKSQGPVRIGL